MLLTFLPASVLALLAGACFGLAWGIALVYIANIIGQTISFLLTRFLLRDSMQAFINTKWKRFHLIDAAIQREGWRLIFVLRLNPCMPYPVLNYSLGLTSITLREYSWASALFIVPYVVAFVYIGCLSSNVFELLDGGWAAHGDMLPWAVTSALLMIAIIVYGVYFTKQALAQALDDAMTPKPAGSDLQSLELPTLVATLSRVDRSQSHESQV